MSWAVRMLVNLTPRRRLLPAKESRSTLDKMMSLYRSPRVLSAARESGKGGQQRFGIEAEPPGSGPPAEHGRYASLPVDQGSVAVEAQRVEVGQPHGSC